MRIVCDCGNTLGRIVDGVYVICHRGRRIVCTGVQVIGCEDCGRAQMVAKPTPPERERQAAAS